ncbi:hypothetical protein G5I_01967 [Acromyrmex echinatior]|uniref:Uncharacterized protein n=1 Tax=Acromyrmex echinatior TaxID=103372 RepID=F4W921_ACREC|nr:hypothetical protein G5I_01967 [Acromyrmex echinatior]
MPAEAKLTLAIPQQQQQQQQHDSPMEKRNERARRASVSKNLLSTEDVKILMLKCRTGKSIGSTSAIVVPRYVVGFRFFSGVWLFLIPAVERIIQKRNVKLSIEILERLAKTFRSLRAKLFANRIHNAARQEAGMREAQVHRTTSVRDTREILERTTHGVVLSSSGETQAGITFDSTAARIEFPRI